MRCRPRPLVRNARPLSRRLRHPDGCLHRSAIPPRAGPQRPQMTRADIFEFFRRLAEANPSPTTELESSNTYQLLVAVVLSAQATDASVNVATRPLFMHIKTPKQMVDFGEDALREAIKTIGLFNTKAKNVIGLSQALIR